MAGSLLKEKGLKATFLQALEGWPSQYQKLCTIVPSNADSEKYAYLGAPPAVREFLGPRQFARLSETTYEIKNKKWEASIRIDKDDWDDDQTGAIQARVQQLAEYSGRHPDELVFGTLIPGGTAALCYDGQYFYDDDHADPEAEYSTSQDNDLTADIVTPAAPTTVEFHAALKACLLALRTFKDSRGHPINPPGAKIILEGPPYYEYIFAKFMSATLLGLDAATNAEDGNIWKGMIAGYILNPWGGETDRFRVHVVDGALKPFIFQSREPLSFKMISPMSDNDFQTWNEDAIYAGVKARYNAGYGLWQKSVSYIFT